MKFSNKTVLAVALSFGLSVNAVADSSVGGELSLDVEFENSVSVNNVFSTAIGDGSSSEVSLGSFR